MSFGMTNLTQLLSNQSLIPSPRPTTTATAARRTSSLMRIVNRASIPGSAGRGALEEVAERRGKEGGSCVLLSAVDGQEAPQI